MAEDHAEEKKDEAPPASKLGRFIQTYHSFLSSFVIGAAGLIATSIWQYRQGEVTRRQADAQQKVAETNAENQWRIERAEILSKNLQVLASQGPGSVEQRYGVLLSLTRGNIIDPELAVSYALELGKDNPDYMESVLANTQHKDYLRLSHAYVLSCEERFGVTRAVPACANDKLEARSRAIADLVGDELQAASSQGQPGPLALLKDEREVQQNVARLTGLFDGALTDYYERRLWNEIDRFQSFSPGAHVVGSLVLATARTGELVTDDEAAKLDKFHDDEAKWLSRYLMGRTCDAECKGKLLDVMLSRYEESGGDYDLAVKQLLTSPHAASGHALSRLHARLLWCQVDDSDLEPLRDNVLVPAMAEVLARPKPDATTVDDLVGMLALVPEPTEKDALDKWKAVMATLEKTAGGRPARVYRDRRAAAEHERQDPPPALKKVTFCNAPEMAPTPSTTE